MQKNDLKGALVKQGKTLQNRTRSAERKKTRPLLLLDTMMDLLGKIEQHHCKPEIINRITLENECLQCSQAKENKHHIQKHIAAMDALLWKG